MIKNTVNGLLVAALVVGGTQAMEIEFFTPEEYKWLAQEQEQEREQKEEREFAEQLQRALQESSAEEEARQLQKREQEEAARQEAARQEAARQEAARQEAARQQQESIEKTARNLELYVRNCTVEFNSAGFIANTKENETEVGKLVDDLKLELRQYNFEDLRRIHTSENFVGLNSIVKGVLEQVLLDKFEEQKEGKIIEDIFPRMNYVNETESPICTHEHKSPEFKILKTGDNLLCTMGEEAFFKYDYGIKTFERENSSGNNNCCLLFSIIDNAAVYAKVMGINIHEAQQWLDANPELSNVSPLDCGDLNRRDFKPVRRKFFDDIITNLDKNVVAQNAQQTTLRAFMENGFRTCPHEDVKMIFSINEQVSDVLDYLHNGDIPLEKFFATAFGWIYDVKVVVLNGDIDNKGNPYRCILENANMGHPELMPMITPEDVPNLIYVYVGGDRGGHYQKLKVLG